MAALAIGDAAPDFFFIDDAGQRCALTDLDGTPIILTLTPGRPAAEPLQRLTFHGESVSLLSPADSEVARAYGVFGQPAVFVVSGGTIVWRATRVDGFVQPHAADLTRHEFVAAMLAASLAATFARSAFGETPPCF